MIRTLRAFDPHSIKLVIFDLDGTLIDSRLDLVHSVNAAIRHIGKPELPEHLIASYVGDGAPALIQRALGGDTVDEALIRKGLAFFLTYYRDHKLDHTTLYEGIKTALSQVRNSGNGVPRKMAVLTNKPVNPSRAIALKPRSPILRARASCFRRAALGPNRLPLSATPILTSRPGTMHDCGPWA
jgi:phosphoglycolate phosphatase